MVKGCVRVRGLGTEAEDDAYKNKNLESVELCLPIKIKNLTLKCRFIISAFPFVTFEYIDVRDDANACPFQSVGMLGV